MTSAAENQLSGDAVEAFERDGYVICRGVIDESLINEVNDHVGWLQARHPDVRPEQLGHAFLRDDPFWVVPGSHRGPVAEMRDNETVESVLGKEIAVEVDESQAVDMVLAPGDVEVHHPNIVHGSNANTSPNRRCGLTIRYIPTSTRMVPEPGDACGFTPGRS